MKAGSAKRRRACAWVWVLALLVCHAVQADEHLASIKRRGVLIVGVKTDYPPFGMLSSDATPQGFEHDLAADLAARMGVSLRKVAVTGANRLQALADGRIDVLIATLGDTSERRQIATLIEPDYYSSGVTLMTRPDSLLRKWSDLRGQKVCATQGSYFNRPMATRYLLDLQMYANGRDAKLGVRDGRCAGWLFDNTAIAGDLLAPEWRNYQTRLPPQLLTPWAIAIAQSDQGSELERFIGDTVADWHRRGTLIALEHKWGLPPSAFLADMHTLWNRTGSDHAYACHRLADGQWPVLCRNPIYVTSTETNGLHQWGLLLKEKTGVDLSFVYDAYERHAFLHALWLTLALTVCCVSGSLACGWVFAFTIARRLRFISRAVQGLVLLGRMTPPLLQIYVLLFGLGSVAAAQWGWQFNAFLIVVLSLSWYTGAGIAHILAGAAQDERVRNAGFRLAPGTLRPLLSRCSAAISASLVNVTKATVMASVVAIPELLSAATSIIAEHGTVQTMMNTLMLLYFLLVFTVFRLLRWVERRWCDDAA
jgi:polar amino acid transport system substrate-binding protein